MAGQANLDIGVNLDVARLQTNAALAKAELQSLTKEANALAKQVVATSDEALKAKLTAELQGVTGQMGRTRSEIGKLNAELAEMAEQSKVAAGGFKAQIASMGESVEGLNRSLAAIPDFAGKFAEIGAAGFGLERVIESVKEVAESAEKLERLSQITGLSTEELQGLQVAAVETGSDFDGLTKVMVKFGNNLQEAVEDPSSKAARTLKAMFGDDFDAEEAMKKPGEALEAISRKLASYNADLARTMLETNLFGAKIGAELLPALQRLGDDGFEKLIARGREFGTVLTEEQITALVRFEHEGKAAGEIVDGLSKSFGGGFVGQVNEAAGAVQHITGLIGILDKAFEGLGSAIPGIIASIVSGLGPLGLSLAGIASSIDQIAARDRGEGKNYSETEIPEVEAQIAALKAEIGSMPKLALVDSAEPGVLAALEAHLKGLRSQAHNLDFHDVNREPFGSKTEAPILPDKEKDETGSSYMRDAEGELTAELRGANGGKGAYGEQALAEEHEFWTKRLSTLRGDGAAVVAERREIEAKLRQIEVSEQSKGGESQKQALAGWFSAYKAGIDEQIGAARGHWAEEVRLVESYVETARALYGRNSAEFAAAQKEQASVSRQIQDEIAAKQSQTLKSGLGLIDKGRDTDLNVSKSNFHALGSPEEAAQDAQRIILLAQAMKEKILNIYTGLAAGDEKLLAEIQELRESSEQATLDKLIENNAQAAEMIRGQWDKVNSNISSELSGAIMDALEGKKGGFGAALQKWGDSQIQAGLGAVLDKGLGAVEGGLGIDKDAPGTLAGKGLDAIGLGGVSKFLGLGADTAKDAPLITSQTALMAAINANTAALGGTIPALAANSVATTANSGASITAAGAAGAGAAASAANTVTTGANTAVQSGGILAWISNTAATIANTISTDAAAVGKFLGFAGGGSPPVGVPSIVGERGPEIFVPRQAGVIHPNWSLSALRAPGFDVSAFNMPRYGSPSFGAPRMSLPDYAFGGPGESGSEGSGAPTVTNVISGKGGIGPSATFHQHNHFSGGEATSGEEMLADLVGKHGRSGVQSLAAKLMR